MAKLRGGAYKGRKRSLTPTQSKELRRRVDDGESKTILAMEFAISRQTLYRYLEGRELKVLVRHTVRDNEAEPGREAMRVLVETLDTVIEGDVIGGEPLDGVSGGFNLEAEFTVRCDNGQCFSVHRCMVEVEVLRDSPEWVM